EADVADAERWTKIMIALRNAEHRLIRIDPGSSADDRQRYARTAGIAGLAAFAVILLRSRRIIYGRRGVVVRLVRVCSPLSNVAEHVIQAPGVWLFASHGMRLIVGVLSPPRDVRKRTVSCAGCSRARRVFPFRFRGQTVAESIVAHVQPVREINSFGSC